MKCTNKTSLPKGCLDKTSRTQLCCSLSNVVASCKGNTCEITPADRHLGTAKRQKIPICVALHAVADQMPANEVYLKLQCS